MHDMQFGVAEGFSLFLASSWSNSNALENPTFRNSNRKQKNLECETIFCRRCYLSLEVISVIIASPLSLSFYFSLSLFFIYGYLAFAKDIIGPNQALSCILVLSA